MVVGEEERVVSDVRVWVGSVVSVLVGFVEPLDVALVLVSPPKCLVPAPEPLADPVGSKDRGLLWIPDPKELHCLKFLRLGIVVAEGAVGDGHSRLRGREESKIFDVHLSVGVCVAVVERSLNRAPQPPPPVYVRKIFWVGVKVEVQTKSLCSNDVDLSYEGPVELNDVLQFAFFFFFV